MIFGLIWILIIIDYCANFIVIYASTTYYFNSPNEEGEDGTADVMEGVKLAHMKHLGTIVFGALIITIIKILRFVFVYLAKKMVE